MTPINSYYYYAMRSSSTCVLNSCYYVISELWPVYNCTLSSFICHSPSGPTSYNTYYYYWLLLLPGSKAEIPFLFAFPISNNKCYKKKFFLGNHELFMMEKLIRKISLKITISRYNLILPVFRFWYFFHKC